MTKKPCCLLSYRVSIGKVEVSELADFSLIFLNDRFGVNDLSSFERLRLVDCCRRAVAAARDNQLASGIGTLDFEVSSLYPRVALLWVSELFGLPLGDLSRNTFGGRHASASFRAWLQAERNREFHIGKETIEMAPVQY